MRRFTIKEWEERFDELFSLVENGETISVFTDDGREAVFVPYDLHKELND